MAGTLIALEPFLERALVDPQLRIALRGCRTTEAFVEAALPHLSATATSEDLTAALMTWRSHRRTLAVESLPEEEGWLPVGVEWREGKPEVRWCWLGRRRLIEPFFSDTIAVARREPFSRFIQPVTPIEALEQRAATHPGLPLAGLIAHVSRCGSTLVSQMLGSLSGLVVASEPPPFDDIVRGGPEEVNRGTRVRWLRAMASALGQRREGSESGFVMKLDSWHLVHLALIREAFPDVPLLLLYREPAAVLASHMREPGLHTGGPGLGDPFDAIPFPGSSPMEYRARVLAVIFGAAVQAEEGSLLVSYTQLPEALRTRIAPFFGLSIDAASDALMRSVERRDAKAPAAFFTAGAGRPSASARNPELLSCADRWMGESHRALEARRQENESRFQV